MRSTMRTESREALMVVCSQLALRLLSLLHLATRAAKRGIDTCKALCCKRDCVRSGFGITGPPQISFEQMRHKGTIRAEEPRYQPRLLPTGLQCGAEIFQNVGTEDWLRISWERHSAIKSPRRVCSASFRLSDNMLRQHHAPTRGVPYIGEPRYTSNQH